MLRIRLSRVGKKKRPSYRVVVSERHKDPWGDHIEIVGFYDPVAEPKQVRFENDRVLYWLSVGAQPTPTVHNLLVDAGVVDAKKVRATKGDQKAVQKAADGENGDQKQEEPKEGDGQESPQDEKGQEQNSSSASKEGEEKSKEEGES